MNINFGEQQDILQKNFFFDKTRNIQKIVMQILPCNGE
jgi:hypothetical protein